MNVFHVFPSVEFCFFELELVRPETLLPGCFFRRWERFGSTLDLRLV